MSAPYLGRSPGLYQNASSLRAGHISRMRSTKAFCALSPIVLTADHSLTMHGLLIPLRNPKAFQRLRNPTLYTYDIVDIQQSPASRRPAKALPRLRTHAFTSGQIPSETGCRRLANHFRFWTTAVQSNEFYLIAVPRSSHNPRAHALPQEHSNTKLYFCLHFIIDGVRRVQICLSSCSCIPLFPTPAVCPFLIHCSHGASSMV